MRGKGNPLGNMGVAYGKMGLKEKAPKCFDFSRAIFRRLGLSDMVAVIENL